jgi:Tfp pilus assembly protein PilO
MRRLSKQKTNQLIIVSVLILGLLAGFWFGVIQYQQDLISSLASRHADVEKNLKQVRDADKNSDRIEAELAAVEKALEMQEEDMAPENDPYAWVYKSIRKFKERYQVDIPKCDPGAKADMNLFPKFPYKQFTVTISGTAHYHDLGKFVADFENQFPTLRVLNLDLVPAAERGEDDRDRLSFKMDIVTLVKSGPSRTANTP